MRQLGHLIRQAVLLSTFTDSKTYWQRRYQLGGASGLGSMGRLAEFKAEIINRFVQDNEVKRVIEFGCGDGSQLALADYPLYLGLDVSKSAVQQCAKRFKDDPGKSFLWYDPATVVNVGVFFRADLTLSLDVIYHVVETEAYEKHLDDLFSTAERFVIIYSSDDEEAQAAPHVQHRKFSTDVGRRYPFFRHIRTVENRYPEESFCSFFIFERSNPA